MAEWVTPVASLASAALGAGIVLLTRWIDKREQYRKATFQRRLKAHQEAIALCHAMPRKLLILNNTTSILAEVIKYTEWWEHDCLYLDARSRRSFYLLINLAAKTALNRSKEHKEFNQMLDRTCNQLAEGIGEQHLLQVNDIENARSLFSTKRK